jgi:diguanylate cyclase (GGDEF)-like protein
VDTSLNPLTSLPGNPSIEEFIKNRIAENKKFGFAYIDADNFKAYNDVYGYNKGDEVIKKIAEIILENAKKISPNDYFVGHVGGDDFVLITDPKKTEKIAQAIISDFDNKILGFYNEEDRKNRFIKTLDRQNNMRTFPIMTLSIALVIPDKPVLYPKIIENAFEIKRYLKTFKDKKESQYHKDRRINE